MATVWFQNVSLWRQWQPAALLVLGQSRRVQVALQLPHSAPVQGAQVKVKCSVCDVEVSRLLDEVHYLLEYVAFS